MRIFKRVTLALCCLGALAAVAEPYETAAQREARLSWWREARFGMFIHWGPVSLTGGEISWSRANSNPKCPNHGATPVEVYDNLYKQFNPTNFDAPVWARIAKSAGMKYMILTAKHCDGFLLWHSKADTYNIATTPFQRDVCGELAHAARRTGLKIGWYFSPMDWRDPDFRTERNDAFVERMQAELRELLTHYGRVDVLWFDWDGREPLYHQPETYSIVKNSQPKIIINNRLDLGKGDDDNKILSANADYSTPEQRIGRYDDHQPWETCMTLGTQWSWKPNDKIKSTKEVIGILARSVGGDGNLLLNVGPMPNGRIEPRQVQVLQEVGAWLDKNGASVYRTRGGPFKPGDYGASTRRGKTVFVHVLNWPPGPLQLPALPAKIVRARLRQGAKVDVRQTATGIEISVPPAERDAADTVIALELDQEAMKLPAVDVPPFPTHFVTTEPVKYADNRPGARWRLEARDAGRVLKHSAGPSQCDYLGARDVWVWEGGGTYYMHYDGAGTNGWLACLATSTDLTNWTPRGAVLELGQSNELDSASASYGTTFLDGKTWHMFYMGTRNVSRAPDLIPVTPYFTMKARGDSPLGPWIKQQDVVPFRCEPNTYYSDTASPGHIVRQGDEYLMFFSAATPRDSRLLRTIGLARTRNLDGPWTVEPQPIVPSTEQVENSSLYFEPANQTWFLFSNHVGVEKGDEFTDSIWVYWTKDLRQWNPEHKAVVLDGKNCGWSRKCIGLPSVLKVGRKLAIFYDAPGGDRTTHMTRDVGLAWIDLPLIPPPGT